MDSDRPLEVKEGLWYVTQKKGLLVVRKNVKMDNGNFKQVTLPRPTYQHIPKGDEIALKAYVTRLNYREQTKFRLQNYQNITNSFIPPQALEDFHKLLLIQIPNKTNANSLFFFLKKYFLEFFIAKHKLNDPIQWHKASDTLWAAYLLSDEVPKSMSTKHKIVNVANRFFKFLHKQYPSEVPPLVFSPLSRASTKAIIAKNKLEGGYREGKYIPDDHWQQIKINLPNSIRSIAILAYSYGLRRNEALGLKPEDVKNGYLSIERQLESIPNGIPKYTILKGRENKRKCPHWFITPAEAYELISNVNSILINPSTVTDHFSALIKRLNYSYKLHDLRHTWVTNALKQGYLIEQVRLAAGHKHQATTARYSHDHRLDLDDKNFIPNNNSF